MERVDGELFRLIWTDDAEWRCNQLNVHRIDIT
jgi:hypothetical protein